MTIITVRQPEKETTISDALFGCNLELTRRTGWSGLYAQMLNNRKFYAIADGAACGWQAAGPLVLRTDLENSVCRSRFYEMEQGSSLTTAGETIALDEGRDYLFAVYVRGQARFTVTVGDGEQSVSSLCFDVDAQQPERLEKRFTASRTLDNGTFRLELVEGRAEVFVLSLLPADHFHQMRRDVVECLKQLAPSALRFPGGCLADHYPWKDGLLPVDCRPPIDGTEKEFLLRDSYHQDAYEINVDDFMALCRFVGAQPELTVRLVNAPQQEAVELVEYCNGSEQTVWGKVRASRGYAPYGVRNWYVGNEIYMFGHEMTEDGAAAARITDACIQAMRRVDPEIQATVTSFSLRPWWNDPYMEGTAPLADYYSYHYYLACQFDPWWQKVTEEMVIGVVENGLLPELANTYARIQALPPDRHRAVSFDEWNYAWGVSGSTEMMLCNSLILNFLCSRSQDYGVEKALFFHPINEGMIRVEPRTACLDTTGEVMRLFSPHRNARRLECQVEGGEKAPSAAASRTENGVYLTVVNRNTQTPQTVRIEGERLENGQVEASAVLLSPERFAFDCDNICRETVQLEFCTGGWELNLPPAAVAGVTFLLSLSGGERFVNDSI